MQVLADIKFQNGFPSESRLKTFTVFFRLDRGKTQLEVRPEVNYDQ
jgi:hypothetical protein